ncbi:response regulator transcription factor [Pandoraea sputorum]|uniref:LuxR family transcriptional regulator n=1 Tax=Pandoraea sputorum TaxID=93222 RepID=A0A5E5BLQ3_9BURK|nr:response regulator transcription factor [Pandoraea sputorum]VVE85985.1 LuxR family transcriptional regulator [Pandoraea sputorum]
MIRTSQAPSRVIRVIVADDHPVVGEGIGAVLSKHSHIKLQAVCVTIESLMGTLGTVECDVLICDYSFEQDSEPDGLHLLHRIRRKFPQLAVIVLTGHQDIASLVRRVMNLGVAGFLRKSSDELSRLPTIVRNVHAGGKYLDPQTAGELLGPDSSSDALNSLSERELEVFRLVGRGMSVTEIAMRTNRSVKTVSSQKLKAMQKLGAKSDAELFRLYLEHFG